MATTEVSEEAADLYHELIELARTLKRFGMVDSQDQSQGWADAGSTDR